MRNRVRSWKALIIDQNRTWPPGFHFLVRAKTRRSIGREPSRFYCGPINGAILGGSTRTYPAREDNTMFLNACFQRLAGTPLISINGVYNHGYAFARPTCQPVL